MILTCQRICHENQRIGPITCCTCEGGSAETACGKDGVILPHLLRPTAMEGSDAVACCREVHHIGQGTGQTNWRLRCIDKACLSSDYITLWEYIVVEIYQIAMILILQMNDEMVYI